MRIFYDTEFTSLDSITNQDMISAGFVTEDNREFYIEITDFVREDCSQFVLDTVLPLLGSGDVLPQRMAAAHFGWRLCHWLDSLDAIEFSLISDSTVDWWLVREYAHSELSTYPRKVRGEKWVPSDDESIKAALSAAEAEFWARPGNVGMVHHALYDARRLKLLAETQQRLYV